jgi:hypothetical protein
MLFCFEMAIESNIPQFKARLVWQFPTACHHSGQRHPEQLQFRKTSKTKPNEMGLNTQDTVSLPVLLVIHQR